MALDNLHKMFQEFRPRPAARAIFEILDLEAENAGMGTRWRMQFTKELERCAAGRHSVLTSEWFEENGWR